MQILEKTNENILQKKEKVAWVLLIPEKKDIYFFKLFIYIFIFSFYFHYLIFLVYQVIKHCFSFF